MDYNLETPYEEEDEFIECTVCNKSIRGETLYKIHLTTPGHIKVFHRFKVILTAGNEHPRREDIMVAEGQAVRQQTVPEFKSILHYLDYMKLDEPIIGLDYLDEPPPNYLHAASRYTCRLCQHNANLPEMVSHVIGRKHRLKYMESKRPDLVTIDKQTVTVGKIIRARAEIIERQDGRGTPLVVGKKGIEGKLNILRVPPRQRQNRGRNVSQSWTQRDEPPQPPELRDYQDGYFHPGRSPSGFPNKPQFHSEEPYMGNRDGPMYNERMQEQQFREDYRDNDTRRQEYMDPDYRTEYEEDFVDVPQRTVTLKPGGEPRYDPREEMPRGQAQHEYNSEDAPPYRKPYPKRDALTEFYHEEVRRKQDLAAKSQPAYEGGEQRRSLDRDSDRNDSVNRAGRPGSREPEGKRGSFPTPMEMDRSHGHLFKTIIEYSHKIREPHQEEAAASPGPSRTGPPTPPRRVEATRALSDIPEPFRRFLKGAVNDVGPMKRKRKSRFSDATAEEVETTREMFSYEHGPPNPKFGRGPRPVSAPLRPEIHGREYPDRYTESQSPHYTESYQSEDPESSGAYDMLSPHHSESYQREGPSESSSVFDMLKNIDIENAEEADFLKNKLCNLLKEFKSKQSEKAAQKNYGRSAISQDYNSLNLAPEVSPRHQYDTTVREDSDYRQPEGLAFNEDHRGRGWQQHKHIPDEPHQEYHHPVRGQPRQSNRTRYEEVFGGPRMSQMPHATHPDEPNHYPERFQEPTPPRDYPPPAREFFDSHSPAPVRHMERGPRMNRGGPRYSNNLDKITSTLLELVARK